MNLFDVVGDGEWRYDDALPVARAYREILYLSVDTAAHVGHISHEADDVSLGRGHYYHAAIFITAFIVMAPHADALAIAASRRLLDA